MSGQSSYQVFDKNGKKSSLDSIISMADSRPLIFFGELHDQEFAHLAELDLEKGLYEKYNNRLILGMEMFEADVQPIINEYFSDQIKEKSFETEARIWSNYKTDYKAIVDFAKSNSIDLIATNIPRRYANSVYHNGMEILNKLSPYAKQFFPELPINIDSSIEIYQEILEMNIDHTNMNLVYSQALKDATMAYFILKNMRQDAIFLHLNGAYHSKKKQGILSFLNGYPLEKTITINTILDDEGKDIDYSTSDFTILKTP